MQDYTWPDFHVEIDRDACTHCKRCVKECGWEVFTYDETLDRPIPDDSRCRACHRCTLTCPARCITVKKSEMAYHDNPNWPVSVQQKIWKQAATGGVLLTSTGSHANLPSLFDRIALDACQVTNPSIDPLREPMELRTFIGNTEKGSAFRLDVPLMFAPMSFGSVSLNVHKALALAARELGIVMNTGEGGLHKDLYSFEQNVIVQVASGRFGVDADYVKRGVAIEIKVGQGAKPGIGGHLPGEKINDSVSETRMIPQGSDAISPAPHHDIYSIEDLRQLIFALKEASGYKPVGVKIAAVHNVAAIAAGVVHAGAEYVYIDGASGGTGAAPAVIRDNIGIPLELALAAVDTRLREEGIRQRASIIAAGSIRSSADWAKAIALGADACAIGSAALIALGCHQCAGCHTGRCSWGLTTQDPRLTRRLNPEEGAQRLVNLVNAWSHELEEILGAMGVNAVESLRGSRERLRGIELDAYTCELLGIKPAGR